MPAQLLGDEGVHAHHLAEPLRRCSLHEQTLGLPELADVAREEGEQHGKMYAVRAAACEEIECTGYVARAYGIHEGKDGDLGHLGEYGAQIGLRELR